MKKSTGILHGPGLLKNKGGCIFQELLYDTIVTLKTIEKCQVLTARVFSHFCEVLEAGIKQATSSSHFVIMSLVCVSHLEVQEKTYNWNAETNFYVGHTGKFSFLFYSMLHYLQAEVSSFSTEHVMLPSIVTKF